jgi:hypothetical protein
VSVRIRFFLYITKRMSTTPDYNSIYTHISLVILPIQIIFGFFTNLLNILVLSRRTLLRGSPCTHYFLATAVTGILCVIIGPVIQFPQVRFNFAPNTNSVGCKLIPYLYVLMQYKTSVLLVLATFDRFCASTTSVNIRSWSSTRVARRAIIVTALVLPIALSPILVIWYINNVYDLCLTYTDVGSKIVVSINTVAIYGLPPSMMIIFGLLTILNIRAQRSRVASVAVDVTRQRRTDVQLARMLLCQVGAYLIFYLPLGITYTLLVFNTVALTPLTTFIYAMSCLWYQCFSLAPFFLYTLSASVYRRELIRMVFRNKEFFRRNQTIVNTIARNPNGGNRITIIE